MHDPGIKAALRSGQYDICVIPCFNEGRVEVARKIVSAEASVLPGLVKFLLSTRQRMHY